MINKELYNAHSKDAAQKTRLKSTNGEGKT